MSLSVAQIVEFASRLAAAAESTRSVAGVYPTCRLDGTGEGDSDLAPAQALAFFQERWAEHANTAAQDLAAAATLMRGYANYLSRADDAVGAGGSGG